MPIADETLSRLRISFLCPECNKRIEKDLIFVKGDNGSVEQVVSWWCKYRYCDARHKIQYNVRHTKGKKPELKIERFTSNEEVYNKRFQVLEWSGMESRTKKGKKK